MRISQLASAFWRSFEDRTGARHDFAQRGYLFIASTPAGLAQMREPLGLYGRLRLGVEMLTPSEVAELVPGMRVDDLTGGRFCALDGYGDPVQALAGMAGSAQLAGARLREDLAVESILREGDRVTGVRTREGDVSARRVLVAAGCWTSTVCATAAVAVPIWPYRRSIIESGPIPRLATIPLVVEWESGFAGISSGSSKPASTG